MIVGYEVDITRGGHKYAKVLFDGETEHWYVKGKKINEFHSTHNVMDEFDAHEVFEDIVSEVFRLGYVDNEKTVIKMFSISDNDSSKEIARAEFIFDF